jgi:hypothetical protein
MSAIDCPTCGQRVTVTDASAPGDCPNCFNVLSSAGSGPQRHIPMRGPTANSAAAGGLTLRYQTTGETIAIPLSERVVIGREAHGREVLHRVAQVSRQHCAIDCEAGCYLVTDLGSMNGTFVGVDRRDCRLSPRQPLRNRELLVLGREMFLAVIEGAADVQETHAYVVPSVPVASGAPPADDPPPPLEFECQNCREYRAPEPPPDGVCPKCSAYTPPR